MALGCVIVWGSSFVVTKSLMQFLQPVQLMLLRFILAYCALWVIYPKWYFKWKEEWHFLIMAFFANTLYSWASNTAITLTQTTTVGVLVATSPIITALLLPLFYKQERLTKEQAAGFGLSFIGVVLVVFNGRVAIDLQPAGALLALLAATSWAIYGILFKRWSGSHNSVLITRKLMFYGILTIIPMVINQDQMIDFSSLLTVANLTKLLFLSFVSSAMCFLLWGGAIHKIGVLKASLYTYVQPLVTLIVSTIFLKEKITFMGFIGILLVIVGMIYATITQKSEQ